MKIDLKLVVELFTQADDNLSENENSRADSKGMARSLIFLAQRNSLSMMDVGQEVREALAERGLMATGLRICAEPVETDLAYPDADNLVGSWQAMVDGQWISTEGLSEAIKADLDALRCLALGRSGYAKTNNIVVQCMHSMILPLDVDEDIRRWRTLDISEDKILANTKKIVGGAVWADCEAAWMQQSLGESRVAGNQARGRARL